MNSPAKPYAGLVLAAGSSSRYSGMKVLADWEGQALLRFLCLRMLKAGLDPVRVVLGAYRDDSVTVLQDLPVEIIDNRNWEHGMVTSLQSGIDGLDDDCQGVVMTLADQPYLPIKLIHGLLELADASTSLVLPRYESRTGHPVLWLNCAFAAIRQLNWDQKPRDIQSVLQIVYLEWDNAFIFEDIDNRSDYIRLSQWSAFHESNKA